MTELDKFKRRMIRSVARLLLHEKKPEDEVWEELRKETGCDCKLLWQRMRALTVKKLQRLLAADDRVENIAVVARLSQTDWLLFDMVLAHEQVDVIGREKITATNVEYKPLMELFSLVQRFALESERGDKGERDDKLLERWAAATDAYNNQGHQCSLMLLQRRWYQIKELTKHNFYELWFSYRGNDKLWDNAQQYRPSRLQMAIAKRFPHVVTQTFLTWEEQIERGLVILPEALEERIRTSELPKPCDENDPDLVVMEPVIETIDLGMDSDSEDMQDRRRSDTGSEPAITTSGPGSVTSSFNTDEDSNTMTSTDINLSAVKSEPQDEVDGLSNVKILQTTHIAQETIDTTDVTNEETLSNVKVEVENPKETFKRNLLSNVNKFIESTQDMLPENNPTVSTDDRLTGTEQEIIEENESMATEKVTELESQNSVADEMIKEKAEQFLKSRDAEAHPEIQNSGPDDITKEKADQFSKNKTFTALSATKDISVTVPEETIESVITDYDDSAVDNIIKQKAEQYISKSVNDGLSDPYTQEDSNDSVVDDIIKQKAEEFIHKSQTKPDEAMESSIEISNAVVVDEGIEFVDDEIEYVEEKDSNADSNDGSEVSDEFEETDGTTPKFDLKLLMKPIIYTMKLDNMAALQGNSFESVYDKDLIEKLLAESKPVSNLAIDVVRIKKENEINQQLNLSDDKKLNDDLFTPNDLNDSLEYESDTDISEDIKVKPTSYLLQKPRSRSYNPIQLCKNPDFNTRLKRLTVGFFSSPRNRQLIKACKPMTIDLNKAFETKLVNGTLYLKSSSGAPQPVIIEDKDQSERNAVVPSAMPLQSLIDNTICDMLSPIPNANASTRNNDETAERNKVINLPDITEIRRINQRLQTAEVTPIRMQYNNDVCKTFLVPPLANLSVSDNNLSSVRSETTVNLHESITKPLLNSIIGTSSDLPVNQSNVEISSVTSLSGVNSQDNVNSSVQLRETDNIDANVNLPVNPTIARHSLPVDTSIVNPPLRQTSVQARFKRIGRPPTKPDKPKTKVPPFYPLNYMNPVPWNKPTLKTTTTYSDDILLTIDTLNKMINKMSGQDLYKNPDKKKKKQNWVLGNVDDETKEKSNVTNPVVEKSTVKVQKVKPKTKGKKNRQRHRKKYCCWSNYMIDKVTLNKDHFRVHTCPLPICNCCCQKQVAIALNEKEAQLRNVTSKFVPIVLSDDEDDALRNACASIETVVQQVSTPTPIVRVMPSTKKNTTNMTLPLIANASAEQGSIRVIEAAMLQHDAAVSSNSAVFSHSFSTANSSNIYSGRGLPLNIGNVSSQENSNEQTQINGPIVSTLIPEETQPFSLPNSAVNSDQSPSNKMYIPVPHTGPLLKVPKISMETQTTTDLLSPQNVSDGPQTINSRKGKQRQFALMSMDTFQRKLVIDGSKKQPVTRRVIKEKFIKKEKVLSLNMSNKPIESPIFLGKNKILLTTIKFPRAQFPQVESVPRSKVIQTPPLPPLLMSNGELTYAVDPGVALNEEHLLQLPNIIAAIQQQLQPVNKAATITQDEVIKLSDDENTSPIDENVAQESVLTPSPNQYETPVPLEDRNQIVNTTFTQEITVIPFQPNESEINVASLKETNADLGSAVKPLVNTENISDTSDLVTTKSNSETIVDQEGDDINSSSSVACAKYELSKKTDAHPAKDVDTTAENNSEEYNECDKNLKSFNEKSDMIVNDSVSTSRNLLSDLMEMSGISAEDTKHTAQEPVVVSSNPADTCLSNNIIQSTLLNAAVPSSAALEPMNLLELNAVTSIAELKYACEHNGQFFKLDLDTGVIVAIKVCVRKNPKSKLKSFETVSTIDLTDDAESSNSANTMIKIHRRLEKVDFIKKNPDSLTKLCNNSSDQQKTEAIKPVKLFKAVHNLQSLNNKASILNRKALSPKFTFVTSKSGGTIKIKQKRKQSLDKIEAKIDLVDSDAPMEEEYLLDSSESEDEYTVTPADGNASTSDDSDDEPLAKKAKRMKSNNTIYQKDGDDKSEKNAEIETATIEDNPSELSSVNTMPAHSTTSNDDTELNKETASKDMDTDYFDTMESDRKSLVSFMDDDDNDSQDDCILGV